jgi:acetylornithine deacetylase/succinyl-diaminopimelate desuccinylase-like protein
MTIDELHGRIDRNWEDHLLETRDLLRIPSVSMTGEGIEESAEAISKILSRMGVQTTSFKHDGKGFPLVGGHLDAGADRDCLVYGMYDVQPVGELDHWEHPPFDATIVESEPFGEILVNRGVYNSKGALAGILLAIETMMEADDLPMNVHFLIEGEEEIGGRSFPEYVKQNRDRLSEAKCALSFDYLENSSGTPTITLGVKGCVYMDLHTSGSTRGGPTGETHSSEAVWVESPVWRLIHAISSMVDSDQRPAIDGLWDDVRGVDDDDRSHIAELAKVFRPEDYLRGLGVERFKGEGTAEELLTRYMFEPSINIDGILAGYTEQGSKTVLPPEAMCKIDIRLVPDMTIEGTRRKLIEHLQRRGFDDVRVTDFEHYPWSKVPATETVSRAVIEAMRFHGREPEVWPMSAGSAPMYLFDQVLGVPWGAAGLGHGGRAHAPNEFAVVEKMRDFEKSVVTVFHKFVEMDDLDAA